MVSARHRKEVLINEFQIVERIGSGATGEVLCASLAGNLCYIITINFYCYTLFFYIIYLLCNYCAFLILIIIIGRAVAIKRICIIQASSSVVEDFHEEAAILWYESIIINY